MPKKIISFLLIASCCFNSVPVQADPNYSHVEGEESTSVKKRATPPVEIEKRIFGEGEKVGLNLTSLDPYRGYAPDNSTVQTVEAGSSVRRNLNGTVDGRFNATTPGYLNITDLTPTPYQISGPGNGNGLSSGTIAASASVGISIIMTLVGCVYYWRKDRQTNKRFRRGMLLTEASQAADPSQEIEMETLAGHSLQGTSGV
jgi:hypothetical protein